MAIKKTNVATETKQEPQYQVLEKCGVIAEKKNGTMELRYVSWNGNEPKYDIRTWLVTEDGERGAKGLTLTGEELESLYEIIKKMVEE